MSFAALGGPALCCCCCAACPEDDGGREVGVSGGREAVRISGVRETMLLDASLHDFASGRVAGPSPGRPASACCCCSRKDWRREACSVTLPAADASTINTECCIVHLLSWGPRSPGRHARCQVSFRDDLDPGGPRSGSWGCRCATTCIAEMAMFHSVHRVTSRGRRP